MREGRAPLGGDSGARKIGIRLPGACASIEAVAGRITSLRVASAARFTHGILALALALFASAATENSAEAQATLVRSEPADRVVVAQYPLSIELTFNEPVSLLALQLIGPN